MGTHVMLPLNLTAKNRVFLSPPITDYQNPMVGVRQQDQPQASKNVLRFTRRPRRAGGSIFAAAAKEMTFSF
jgi:hypothetical protein